MSARHSTSVGHVQNLAVRKLVFIATLAASVCVAAGCASVPGSGPLKSHVKNQYEDAEALEQLPFDLVDVSPQTVRILAERNVVSLAATLGREALPPELKVGSGDGLVISIWEAGTQPLFSASSSSVADASGARLAQLPEQIVDADGTVSVPFAGRVQVAGLSISAAQEQIQKALAGKAARAQVLVTMSRNVADSVLVLGEVNVPGRVALSPRGERILDVLASVGGARVPSHEAWLSLTRNGVTTQVPLGQILDNAQENVYLNPGDLLSVSRRAESFTAFGATGRNGQITFESARVNLVEAVAKAGGLLDGRADPRGVYLLRNEPAHIASAVSGRSSSDDPSLLPVVYRLDMSYVQSYFLARNFMVRDGDILYVANSPATTLQKLLVLIGLITQPVVQGVILDNAID